MVQNSITSRLFCQDLSDLLTVQPVPHKSNGAVIILRPLIMPAFCLPTIRQEETTGHSRQEIEIECFRSSQKPADVGSEKTKICHWIRGKNGEINRSSTNK